ncbi:hypothetical protein SPONN_1902 [uncultured Candidatus Thioglobus sp.]|nr:hypothetical protein SPONL_423 [uncultured Candidatus Thioglobus sp.]SMN00683.1 hypothetical protein SPONN_1902 [uncultured Candidatus Thioglobus sp.]
MGAQKEVDNNFAFFKTHLAEFKKNHFQEFALLHNRQAIDFFESENDAIKIGMKEYGEGDFSIQQVADTKIDLGYQSYVII